jgi:2-methylisocitrate lyase-like PEP mutase family enzyme
MSLAGKAAELLRLHTDQELLVLVNVWDVASTRVVTRQPRCRAVATASHAIAASLGYADGEQIPVDVMLDMVSRIAADTDKPVTADLEAGYGDVATTIRRAVSVGVVGANIEDQMRPVTEAAAMMQTAVEAAEQEGCALVLNARTDAYLRAGDRDPADVLADAIARGRAFLDVGASCVFVPGRLDAETIQALVDGIGHGKVSVLGLPGTPPASELTTLGVARVSYGPYPHRVTLASLADTAAALLSGAGAVDLPPSA